MRCLKARFPTGRINTKAAGTARRRAGADRRRRRVLPQAWRVAARGVYVVAGCGAGTPPSTRSSTTCRHCAAPSAALLLQSTHVDDELRVDAAPASLAAACAPARPGNETAGVARARAVRALRADAARVAVPRRRDRCYQCGRRRGPRDARRGHGPDPRRRDAFRRGGRRARAALLRSALALRHAEAREASALQACRGAKTVFNARRWGCQGTTCASVEPSTPSTSRRPTTLVRPLGRRRDRAGDDPRGRRLKAGAPGWCDSCGRRGGVGGPADGNFGGRGRRRRAARGVCVSGGRGPRAGAGALLDPVPAPELPDFPSCGRRLSLAGLSLAEPQRLRRRSLPARTPVPALTMLCCFFT